jgi:hypothetical protein
MLRDGGGCRVKREMRIPSPTPPLPLLHDALEVTGCLLHLRKAISHLCKSLTSTLRVCLVIHNAFIVCHNVVAPFVPKPFLHLRIAMRPVTPGTHIRHCLNALFNAIFFYRHPNPQPKYRSPLIFQDQRTSLPLPLRRE